MILLQLLWHTCGLFGAHQCQKAHKQGTLTTDTVWVEFMLSCLTRLLWRQMWGEIHSWKRLATFFFKRPGSLVVMSSHSSIWHASVAPWHLGPAIVKCLMLCFIPKSHLYLVPECVFLDLVFQGPAQKKPLSPAPLAFGIRWESGVNIVSVQL